MATRADPDDVRAVIETKALDPAIQAVIGIANRLVTQYLAGKSCMTDELLKDIETWISAHYLSMKEQRISSDKMGDAQQSYRAPGVLQTGLESSFYGQQALLLDCSGTLVNLGKPKARFDLAFDLENKSTEGRDIS